MERTFAGSLAQWLSLHSQGRKPRTVQFNIEIEAIVRREWPGYLNAAAARVTSEQVMTFAERVTRYCPSRWNALVSALHFISPVARVLRRRPLRAKERPLVTIADFARLVEELERRPRSRGALVIRFLAHTGLRINEARHLRWSNVEKEYVHVPGKFTKNGKRKIVPFIPGTREIIDQLRAVATGARADFVLPQKECKRALNSACAKVGLPHLAHHDFRHLFTTRSIESGVDIPTVARWLGHSDGGALLSRDYFHLIDEHSRRMAARVVV